MAIIDGTALRSYLDISDANDDPRLTSAAGAASEAVEEWTGRRFTKIATASATAKTFRPYAQLALRIPDFWSTTGLVVKTDDDDNGTYETTWTIDTDFVVETPEEHQDDWPYDRIVPLGTRSFPTGGRRRSVQVTAAWGWSTIPSSVTSAALIKAARVFKRKNSPEGVLGGFGDFGVVRVTTREDPDVTMLLAPYRHIRGVA